MIRDLEAGMAGLLRATECNIAHYGRYFRAQPGLWPTPGSGRGARYSLLSSHLTSMTLSYVGGPPIAAVENANRLRALQVEDILRPDGSQDFIGGQLKKPVLVGDIRIYPTLGETLDAHIADGALAYCSVEIIPEIQRAYLTSHHKADRYRVQFTAIDLLTEVDRQLKQDSFPATISRSVYLWPALFQGMAAILTAASPESTLPDSEPDEAALPLSGSRPLSDPARTTAGPEKTKAAEAPPSTAFKTGQSARKTSPHKATTADYNVRETEQQVSLLPADPSVTVKERQNASTRRPRPTQRAAA